MSISSVRGPVESNNVQITLQARKLNRKWQGAVLAVVVASAAGIILCGGLQISGKLPSANLYFSCGMGAGAAALGLSGFAMNRLRVINKHLTDEENLGDTKLIVAARTGSLFWTKIYLNCGANPVLTGKLQQQALDAAAHAGHNAIVKELLAWGAHPDQQEGEYTALQWAVQGTHLDIVRTLLDAGADKKITSNNSLKATAATIANAPPVNASRQAGEDIKIIRRLLKN